MKKTILFLIFALTVTKSFSQGDLILKKDLPFLNSEIEKRVSQYESSKAPSYWSIPQTIGNYFELRTKDPSILIDFLKSNPSFDELMVRFSDLQIDRNLLVIKNEYKNYEEKKITNIQTFEMGNSYGHQLSNNYGNIETIGDYHFNIHRDYDTKEPESIYGFYLPQPFKKHLLPEKYSDWLWYGENIIDLSVPIFLGDDIESHEFSFMEESIIDSLVNYFEQATKRPNFPKGEHLWSQYRNDLDQWENNFSQYSDSIFYRDKDFRKLLRKSLKYAEKKKISHPYLVDFTAQHISKDRAVNLLRNHQVTGSGSHDSGPEQQLYKIASLTAQSHNWPLFIQAFLNILNDRNNRISDMNIAAESRETHASELTKLKLDQLKLLLGINFRVFIQDGAEHYSGSGSKIAQAFASLPIDYQLKFEEAILSILSNQELDDFNKLHFYNTFLNYRYFMRHTDRFATIDRSISLAEKQLPESIRSKVENPNFELFELLHLEKESLNQFEILTSTIANIYTIDFEGECWQALLVEKHGSQKILYDLTMGIGEKITPLANFIEKMPYLKKRLIDHSFLQNLLNQHPKNKLYVNFVNDRSFIDLDGHVTEDIPEEIVLTKDFANVISLHILHEGEKFVKYLLFEDESVLVMEIHEGYSTPGYSFEQLTSKGERTSGRKIPFYKIFDKHGKMLN